MADAQRRAVENHRRRLRERGLGRFEVRGLETDKALLRALAKRLAQADAASGELRAAIEAGVNPRPQKRGGILRALRRSPLVGADLDLRREVTSGRDVDL
jgi:hypothetical protein